MRPTHGRAQMEVLLGVDAYLIHLSHGVRHPPGLRFPLLPPLTLSRFQVVKERSLAARPPMSLSVPAQTTSLSVPAQTTRPLHQPGCDAHDVRGCPLRGLARRAHRTWADLGVCAVGIQGCKSASARPFEHLTLFDSISSNIARHCPQSTVQRDGGIEFSLS